MERTAAELDLRETVIPGATGEFRMFAWRLHPALQPFVLRHGAYVEPGAGSVRRELPMVGSPLILTNVVPYLLSEAHDPATPAREVRGFIAGLHRTFTSSRAIGRTESFQIDLTPLAAHRFVQGSMRELRDRLLPLMDLVEGGATDFEERVWNADAWPDRIRALEAALIARLHAAAPEPPAIAWFWRQLQVHGTSLNLADTAAEIGWSQKHLIAQSHTWFGMSPKPIARQLRFERAVRIIRGSPRGGTFAGLAARLGYADQAHFTRDFRAFAGVPPSQFVAEDRAEGILLAES